jgi:hypothetical protein
MERDDPEQAADRRARSKARIITLARRAKNGLRVLRANSFGLVRPAYTAGSRSAVRRHAHLPGD